MVILEQAYEAAYREALEAALAGHQMSLPSFFNEWAADTWPPASELIRLHAQLLGERQDVDMECATSFLAQVLAQYDERYQSLRKDFAALQYLTHTATWKYDVVHQRLLWSEQAVMEMGLSAAEATSNSDVLSNLSKFIEQFVHLDDQARAKAALANAADGSVPLDQTFRLMHPTLGVRHWASRGETRRDASGRVTEVFIASWDRNIEIAFQERIRLLEAVLNNINDVVIITEAEPIDPPGPRIVYVNPAFERMTGYTALEVIGQTPRILQGPETSAEARAQIRQALKNWQPIQVEVLNYRKDGSQFWADLAIVPIADATGWYTHWVAVQRDVTMRRRAEAEQRRRSSLEAVGKLSAGIAHNFNNLLAIIQGYGEMVRRDVADRPEVSRRIESILRAVKRGSQLVQELMLFTRQKEAQPQVLDVCQAVQETLDLARRLLPTEIEVEELSRVSPSEQSLRAYLDPSRLSQAVLNLLLNARDAMPSGGRLTVAIGQQFITNPLVQFSAQIVFSHQVEPGDYVFVQVSDTGVGMTAETQRHIFEPFFTTKGVGEGTGLGLATVYGFVAESGGFIVVDSAPKAGTTMWLFFPLVKDEPQVNTTNSG
ncbi:MAG: PAS domain S-box protein [Acidobacteriota bacterium]